MSKDIRQFLQYYVDRNPHDSKASCVSYIAAVCQYPIIDLYAIAVEMFGQDPDLLRRQKAVKEFYEKR